ncbi:hypothetical protein E1264_31165, partial [Actinomadura sp. KC216]|uniref:hypothetical protein n=1 Tax=Actinomadura sp. KC216 TaxID=2530370 RepID=UPI0010D54586
MRTGGTQVIQELDRAAAASERAEPARVTRLIDGLTDGAVLLFAAWTAVYHLGLLFRPPTSVLLAVWLAGAVAIGALCAVRRGWWAGRPWREPVVLPRTRPRSAPGWPAAVA